MATMTNMMIMAMTTITTMMPIATMMSMTTMMNILTLLTMKTMTTMLIMTMIAITTMRYIVSVITILSIVSLVNMMTMTTLMTILTIMHITASSSLNLKLKVIWPDVRALPRRSLKLIIINHSFSQAKIRITQSRFTQFFCIGSVYFGCLQVNSHIQAVQNMCGKGG